MWWCMVYGVFRDWEFGVVVFGMLVGVGKRCVGCCGSWIVGKIGVCCVSVFDWSCRYVVVIGIVSSFVF